jgi:hypothetical protein
MAKLDAAERKEIPAKKFALPKERKYPIEDKSHASNAKARARQMFKSGQITKAQYDEICAKADKVLGKTMAKPKAKADAGGKEDGAYKD